MQIWNPQFHLAHPIMNALNAPEFLRFSQLAWPSVNEYNQTLAEKKLFSLNGNMIRFIAQDESRTTEFSQQYEPRIFLTGEVATRMCNWHDFFQVLVWNLFPKTKVLLNARHYFSARQRHENNTHKPQRSAIENAITLFDEGGAVVVCNDTELLTAIRDFQWKKIFWQEQSRCIKNLRIFGFGHALFEKMLNPYIGLTAHSILMPAPPRFFNATVQQQLRYVDTALLEFFQPTGKIRRPADLQPLPLLGYPGWWPGNDRESFYDNVRYFRPGRRAS
jgi:hypothetical protein